jgi:hypothetical protein
MDGDKILTANIKIWCPECSTASNIKNNHSVHCFEYGVPFCLPIVNCNYIMCKECKSSGLLKTKIGQASTSCF